MSNAEFEALMARLPSLRRDLVSSEFGPIPKSVEYLQERLQNTSDEGDRKALHMLLIGECSWSTNIDLHLQSLQRRAMEFHNDPIALAGLAFGIAVLSPTDRARAIAAANLVLDVALRENRLVRYSAAHIARVGVLIDEYVLVNRAIDILVNDKNRRRSEDTPYEFDFLDGLDRKRCDMNLLRQYEDIRRLAGATSKT